VYAPKLGQKQLLQSVYYNNIAAHNQVQFTVIFMNTEAHQVNGMHVAKC